MRTTNNDSQANIELISKAFRAFNEADLDTCTQLMTDDFIINLAGAPYEMRGIDAWKQNMGIIRGAFPDINAQIEDVFASDDRVAVRLTFRGTHKGEFQGIPATGRKVSYTSIEIYRVSGGKFAEEWISSDIATLMRQLSAPADA